MWYNCIAILIYERTSWVAWATQKQTIIAYAKHTIGFTTNERCLEYGSRKIKPNNLTKLIPDFTKSESNGIIVSEKLDLKLFK